MSGTAAHSVITPRLVVRPPGEDDRQRFVELFRDDAFMVFAGACTEREAHDRFDHMIDLCRTVPFGKQPVVERASGRVVGYTGVDTFDLDGTTWLEWGYRLVPECRGAGYATEAARALLAEAARTYTGELLALVAPDNLPSRRVCGKLGFTYWKQQSLDGDVRNLYTRRIG